MVRPAVVTEPVLTGGPDRVPAPGDDDLAVGSGPQVRAVPVPPVRAVPVPQLARGPQVASTASVVVSESTCALSDVSAATFAWIRVVALDFWAPVILVLAPTRAEAAARSASRCATNASTLACSPARVWTGCTTAATDLPGSAWVQAYAGTASPGWNRPGHEDQPCPRS